MTTAPTVTVIGSCRVYDPMKQLADAGRVRLNQQRVFGFVHNSREVLQQLRLMTGETKLPGRLRNFLNIPAHWKWTPPEESQALSQMFAETDVFIVEISSIRLLRFKSVFLQLNRTRELMVTNDAVQDRWWVPLTRDGRNDPLAYLLANRLAEMPAVNREVLEQIVCSEQTVAELVKDIHRIREALPAPVLFVSHFNAGMEGKPIPQRQTIVDAMHEARRRFRTEFFDPTDNVLAAGPGIAMADAAHYHSEFVPQVGSALLGRAEALANPDVEVPVPVGPDPLRSLIESLD